jgi:anti-sigma factor RsiW
MKYSPDELREMVPLYLNGRLSADALAAFEDALEQDAALKQEVGEFEEIAALYPDIEESVAFPSDERVFARIMDNIDAEEKATAPDERSSLVEKMTEFFRTTFFSPRVAWAVAGVQLVLLVTLVGTLPDKETYQTLSSGQSTAAAAQRLNVVFREEAMEKDIRALLRTIDAGIVAGPLANGLYVIEVRTADRSAEDAAQLLLNSRLVQLAEPNY